MATGPCLCGDPYCPSCGGAMGTFPFPDTDEPPGECEACGGNLPEDFHTGYLCESCAAEAKKAIRQTQPRAKDNSSLEVELTPWPFDEDFPTQSAFEAELIQAYHDRLSLLADWIKQEDPRLLRHSPECYASGTEDCVCGRNEMLLQIEVPE